MNSYNLSGHSGCRVYLMEDENGETFVRKISKDQIYNNRLQAQCRKQAEFRGDLIQAPAIWKQGITEDGLFFFDMDYIQGITLAEYIRTMEIGKIRGLVDMLSSGMIADGRGARSPEAIQIFRKKLSSLRTRLEPRNNSVIHEALDLLERHDWSNMTVSPCHGDLTLENIIVKDERLYLIDFLDSFYDSWFMDAGTLLQDVQVMWSYRFQRSVNMNTVLRLIVFRDILLNRIRQVDPVYEREVYYALLQKLVRIFPYTEDRYTYDFLTEKTKLVTDDIYRLEREI